MTTASKVGDHQWVAFTMAPVIMISDPGSDRVIMVDDLEGEADTTYGCVLCNVGVDVGRNTVCLGFDPSDVEQKPLT